MKQRCSWCDNSKLYQDYHDFEWGVLEEDDKKLFENLILETQQAGLSWLTVLKKRENYRIALDNFDFNLISKYDEIKVIELVNNAGIVRHKLKILSIIKNAIVFIQIRKEFESFLNYIHKFTRIKIYINNSNENEELKNLSKTISKDLKKRGMSFVGETIIYSYLEAIGIIDNHQENCFKSKK